MLEMRKKQKEVRIPTRRAARHESFVSIADRDKATAIEASVQRNVALGVWQRCFICRHCFSRATNLCLCPERSHRVCALAFPDGKQPPPPFSQMTALCVRQLAGWWSIHLLPSFDSLPSHW